MLDILTYEIGSFYVLDKTYIDFERLYIIHQQKAFFITRAKQNMRFKRMYSMKADKTKGIIYDQIGKLEGHYSKKGYP